MPEFKLTIGDPKTGKTFKKVVSGSETDPFRGKKIKDMIIGDAFGMKGYELEITGRSDSSGFPMRLDVEGQGRKRPLLTGGQGVNIKIRGMKKRKTVVGNTLSHLTAQVNLKITKYGAKGVNEILGAEEKKEVVENSGSEKK